MTLFSESAMNILKKNYTSQNKGFAKIMFYLFSLHKVFALVHIGWNTVADGEEKNEIMNSLL